MYKIRTTSGEVLYTSETASDMRSALEEAVIAGTDLHRANLVCADLTCARLVRASLADARLACARLVRANLTDAGLTGANLAGADLTDARGVRW